MRLLQLIKMSKLFSVFLTFTTSLFFTTLTVNATDSFPKVTSASIYEETNKKGPSVAFVDDMELWSDFRKMFHYANMSKPTTICVRGAWLIYRYPDYRIQSTDDVHVFSGNENCVQPADMSQIGSMQPIGPYKYKKNSITVFEKKSFGSFGLSYAPHKDEVKKFRKSWLPTLESFITTGHSSWTLIDTDGHAYCIKSKTSLQHPICLVTDLSEFNQIKDPSFVGVISGCGKEDKTASGTDSPYAATIELTNCREFSGAKMEKITDEHPPSGRTIKNPLESDKCKSETEIDDSPLEEEIITKFTKLRFTHDFESKEQLLWPERKQDIWKTELIDTAFDIMMQTCPDEIVPTSYLQLIREFTIYHLDQVWKASTNDSTKMNKEIHDLTRSLNECLNAAIQEKLSFISQILESFINIHSAEEFNNQINTAFQSNPKYDPVIEATWIVINYGLAICHHLNDYENNFWTEYINVFRELYFLPLIDSWQNPTKISPRSFKVILGGFGVDNQFKRLGFCASIAFELTPNLAPIEKKFLK